MPTKTIDVEEHQKGKIIGKKGWIIKRIQQDTGAMIDARPRDQVHLQGNKSEIDAAEREIRRILSNNTSFQDKNSLLVTVPEFAVGLIIGERRRNLIDIEEETGTRISQGQNRTPHFYVHGDRIQQYKARLKIKEKASNCRRLRGFPFFKKFPFIDDRHVGEDADFALELKDNPHPRWSGPHYGLVSKDGQPLPQERDSPEFSKLCGEIQDILRSLQQREENENLLVDMWCHYGHAYITAVDEDEVDGHYSIREVKKHLEREKCPWQASFIGGVRDLDVDNIEKVLSDYQTVPPYTRCDISFFSPSCRQIRVKIFLKGGENGEELAFCDDGPVLIKNVLERVSRENGPVYYLCAPPVQHIKVHIFIPFVNLDCHFMMRTTFRNITRTPEEEAEDKILIDFLNQNLAISDGKLQLPTKQEQLPKDFDLSYWRQSKRRIYSYNGYKIKISEETLENLDGFETGDDVRKRNDVHIHSNKWDEQFSGTEWQPEQISGEVPDFLSFVGEVQKNITPQESSQEE